MNQTGRPRFDSWVRKIPWRRGRLPTPVFFGFPSGLDNKEPTCNAGDLGSVPGLGRFPGGGHGNPVQYFSLENSMDGGAWWASVNVVSKSWTRLKRLSTAEHKERHPEEGDGGNQELEAFHFALTRPLLLRG